VANMAVFSLVQVITGHEGICFSSHTLFQVFFPQNPEA